MQELIGDEIIDETDRWVNNAQTAPVNPASLTEKLPKNLRAMLALGMFTPRVHPGRAFPAPLAADAATAASATAESAAAASGAVTPVRSGSPRRAAAAGLDTALVSIGGHVAAVPSPAGMARSNSFMVSKISKANTVHAKERAAAVVRAAAESGTADSLL